MFVVHSSAVLPCTTAKSNQQNLGTIKSSNLCTEIIEYSSPDETAVCNLASLALPTFVVDGKYDFNKLHAVAKVVAFNLNRIIDVNYYPTPEARRSNMRHRPIGLGVQGLADLFMSLRAEPQDERAPSAGAKSLCIPFDQSRWPAIQPGKTKCAACGKDAKRWTMFGRSY